MAEDKKIPTDEFDSGSSSENNDNSENIDFVPPSGVTFPEDSTNEKPTELSEGENIEDVRRAMLAKYGRKKEDEEEEKKGFGLLLPRGALYRAAKRVLFANKLNLILIGLATLVALMFLVATSYEKMGNFTINLNRIELYRKGFILSDSIEFVDPQPRLVADSVKRATNISENDIPANLHLLDGNNNSPNYMAYTFYLRNEGRLAIDYDARIVIELVARNVDEAVRVMVVESEDNENYEKTIYAKPNANGQPEKDTVPFASEVIVMEELKTALLPNNFHKYTVVIWLEGDDPDCMDNLIGGMIRLRMDFDASDDAAVVSGVIVE